jgi:hypothetical protein
MDMIGAMYNVDYVLLPLTQGYWTKVDESDLDLIVDTPWHTNTAGKRRATGARGHFNGSKKMLHDVLMNPPKGMEVDHINHDVFDNRRCNLRVCAPEDNAQNHKPRKNKWGTGVVKIGGRFYVKLSCKNKYYTAGRGFDTPEEAQEAYNKIGSELRGEFHHHV